MHPSAYRNAAGIWIDPTDPSFTTEDGQTPSASLPTIYLFSNARNGDGVAYAMAEDGEVLASHWCSHWGYMRHDLHDRPERRILAQEHYPQGYNLAVLGPGEVPPADVLARNKALRDEETEGER